MTSLRLTHLIYSSTPAPEVDAAMLVSILSAARHHNALHQITGMLLHTEGSFFQVIEGDEPLVAELFARIAVDPRHRDATRIISEPIARRAFAEWTMGFSEVSPSDFNELDGVNDFFRQGNSLQGLPAGRARKLLGAFAQGRWRPRLGAPPR